MSAVDHPAHYNASPSGVECIDVVEHMTFNVGNAVKYLWRADHKNGVEDLQKALWYINREIERLDHAQDAPSEAAEWERYWGSLTPEEQGRELRRMDEHAASRGPDV